MSMKFTWLKRLKCDDSPHVTVSKISPWEHMDARLRRVRLVYSKLHWFLYLYGVDGPPILVGEIGVDPRPTDEEIFEIITGGNQKINYMYYEQTCNSLMSGCIHHRLVHAQFDEACDIEVRSDKDGNCIAMWRDCPFMYRYGLPSPEEIKFEIELITSGTRPWHRNMVSFDLGDVDEDTLRDLIPDISGLSYDQHGMPNWRIFLENCSDDILPYVPWHRASFLTGLITQIVDRPILLKYFEYDAFRKFCPEEWELFFTHSVIKGEHWDICRLSEEAAERSKNAYLIRAQKKARSEYLKQKTERRKIDVNNI